MSHPQILVLLTAVLFIIFAGIAGSFLNLNKKIEGFAGPRQDADFIINKEKTIAFVTQGLYNFFCAEDAANSQVFSKMTRTDAESQKDILSMVGFFPNYLDSYCFIEQPQKSKSAIPSPNIEKCTIFHIDNYACPDTSFTGSTACTSLNSTIGARGDNCLVRVMDNNYNFNKRCFRFDMVTINAISMPAGSQIKRYQLKVSGDITDFVLLRPLFVSFGNYGLYKVDYTANDITSPQVNAMLHYTDEGDNNIARLDYDLSGTEDWKNNSSINSAPANNTYTLIVQRVDTPATTLLTDSDPKPSYKIYGTNTSSFDNIPGGKLYKYPMTIFYLNYQSQINIANQNAIYSTRNVLNLVFSKATIDGITKSADGTASMVEKQLVITPPSATGSYKSIVNFKFTFDMSTKLPDNLVKLSYISSQAGATYSLINPEAFRLFKYKMFSLMQSETNFTYHICLTCSLDTIMLVCFLKDISNNKDYIFSSREKTAPVILTYNYTNMESAITSNFSNVLTETKKNRDLYSLTSIPNFAYLAKYFGYSNVDTDMKF